MRNYFSGKYYKFVLKDGFVFALVDYIANKKKGIQLITKEASFEINDIGGVSFLDKAIDINVHQDGLSIEGHIDLKDFHPLKHNAMGPFRIFSMECSHDVYSMYHGLSGFITFNGFSHSLEGGVGYIEGDKGRSFPSKYIWYNSVGEDYGVTLAVATIPFGLINFVGILGFVNHKGKEYRICTYNGAKLKTLNKDKIIIKNRKYELEIICSQVEGKDLKAPTNGAMSRVIKENVAVKTSFIFRQKGKELLKKEDPYSSFEQMYFD